MPSFTAAIETLPAPLLRSTVSPFCHTDQSLSSVARASCSSICFTIFLLHLAFHLSRSVVVATTNRPPTSVPFFRRHHQTMVDNLSSLACSSSPHPLRQFPNLCLHRSEVRQHSAGILVSSSPPPVSSSLVCRPPPGLLCCRVPLSVEQHENTALLFSDPVVVLLPIFTFAALVLSVRTPFSHTPPFPSVPSSLRTPSSSATVSFSPHSSSPVVGSSSVSQAAVPAVASPFAQPPLPVAPPSRPACLLPLQRE